MLDLVIRGGDVHDGDGGPPQRVDVGIADGRVVRLGRLDDVDASEILDADGLAVTPGFVDILSHAYQSVLDDPRSLSTLVQGVTTLVFGEGMSMGPLTPAMVDEFAALTGVQLEPEWTRLSEYLAHVERRGCSQNVASFIGSFNPRMCVLGTDDRAPTSVELEEMQALVAEEMADGALGIGSALIYPPGTFASTDELVALCRAAAPYGGMYISHLRSEGDAFLEALDELLTISREAEVPAEVWHLKAIGRDNWHKMDRAIATIEAARDRGEPISADVYPYLAGGTALFASVPPAFRDGDAATHRDRLADPSTRAAVRDAMQHSREGWENLWLATGGDGTGVFLLASADDGLRGHVGRTIAEIDDAEGRGDPLETLLTLLDRDPRCAAGYVIASEDNLRRQLALPWVSVGSDAPSLVAEGATLDHPTHPRAYGTFARILGTYVREEQVLTLPEAVRRMTSLPADTLGLDRRGRLVEGHHADVVVLDPETVADRATYADPHQYAVGVRDVVVNGEVVLRDGAHTGTFPGRALKGRGRR